MLVRAVTVMVTILVSSTYASDQDATPVARDGETVSLHLSGSLVKEYAKLYGLPVPNDPHQLLTMDTSARISRTFNGKVLIEHSSSTATNDQPPRLITLSAIVDHNHIQNRVTPAGTEIYSSPDDHKNAVVPAVAQAEVQTKFVELSDLKQVTLRLWELSKEVGE